MLLVLFGDLHNTVFIHGGFVDGDHDSVQGQGPAGPVIADAIQHQLAKLFDHFDSVVGPIDSFHLLLSVQIVNLVLCASGVVFEVGLEVSTPALSSHLVLHSDGSIFPDDFELLPVGVRNAEVKRRAPVIGVPHGAEPGDDRIHLIEVREVHLNSFGKLVVESPHDSSQRVPALVSQAPHGLSLGIGSSVSTVEPLIIHGLEREARNDSLNRADFFLVADHILQMMRPDGVEPHGPVHELGLIFLARLDHFEHLFIRVQAWHGFFHQDVLPGICSLNCPLRFEGRRKWNIHSVDVFVVDQLIIGGVPLWNIVLLGPLIGLFQVSGSHAHHLPIQAVLDGPAHFRGDFSCAQNAELNYLLLHLKSLSRILMLNCLYEIETNNPYGYLIIIIIIINLFLIFLNFGRKFEAQKKK